MADLHTNAMTEIGQMRLVLTLLCKEAGMPDDYEVFTWKRIPTQRMWAVTIRRVRTNAAARATWDSPTSVTVYPDHTSVYHIEDDDVDRLLTSDGKEIVNPTYSFDGF